MKVKNSSVSNDSISHLFALSLNVKQFYLTLSGANNPSQREPRSNGNEGAVGLFREGSNEAVKNRP